MCWWRWGHEMSDIDKIVEKLLSKISEWRDND